MQAFQGDAFDNLEGVDDVAKALGHLPTMRISHHAMQVHRVERQLVCSARQLLLPDEARNSDFSSCMMIKKHSKRASDAVVQKNK